MTHAQRRRSNAPTWAILVTVAFCSLARSSAQELPLGEKQKVSEGQYVRLNNNLRVSGSEQDWVLWRLRGRGYELEDHFYLANPADQLLAQLSSAKLSPDLQRKLQTATAQTDLVVRSGADHRPQFLTVRGKKLINGQAVDVLKCEVTGEKIHCRRGDQNAMLRIQQSEEFFYAFPFPMLLSSWLARLTNAPAAPPQRALIVLDGALNSGDKLNLTRCDRRVEVEEDETVTIGDRQFRSHKAKIRLCDQNKNSMELILWYGSPGLVYAMEGGGPSGERMALVRYKKYSDF